MYRLKPLIKNHYIMGAFYKAFSGLALFLSMPILIDYLGATSYGVWILIFTLFQWILLMDFGLASTLKTRIPVLKHTDESDTISAYIRSTYLHTCIIGVIIFFILSCFIILVDVKEIFNINLSSGFVKRLFIINILFFSLNFILNTHKSLFISVHRGMYAEQSIALNQIFFLCFSYIIALLTKDSDIENKLYYITFINGSVCLLINLFYTMFFFKTEPYSLVKTVGSSYINIKHIYRLGLKYMFIQLSTIFLFTSDNYILSYFFDTKTMVPYEIANKYFQFPILILTAGMAPLWSLFSKKYLDRDYLWFKSTIYKFNFYFIFLIVGIIIFTLTARPLLKFWISQDFGFSNLLLVTISALTALRIYTTFYTYFFNGIGNLKILVLLLLLSVLLKIPFSYIFIQLNYGISSVALSTVCCLLIWCIVLPSKAINIVLGLKSEIK